MTTKTPSSFKSKIKEVATYAVLLGFGLSAGFGAKKAYAWYNEAPAYVETNTAAHFANTEQKVVVYSTQWCPFCTKAKQFLTDNNIEFEERDIEKGGQKVSALFNTIGTPGIPKIVIGNKILTGFNPTLLEAELKQQQLL
ncbi:MAG: hypothetical protein MJK04_26145 [Psychrosphaera sp.]|nr:hypothetical protein [Psychrosphaera sp.]